LNQIKRDGYRFIYQKNLKKKILEKGKEMKLIMIYLIMEDFLEIIISLI
jgi:hypothetical protein